MMGMGDGWVLQLGMSDTGEYSGALQPAVTPNVFDTNVIALGVLLVCPSSICRRSNNYCLQDQLIVMKCLRNMSSDLLDDDFRN
jgi:hypothetical protein